MNRSIDVLMVCCLLLAGLAAGQGRTAGVAPPPAAATSSEPASFTCAGKVVDAEGKSVAGATVRVYQWEEEDVRARLAGEMTTKADGAFSFQWYASDDPHPTGQVVARKDGLAVGWDDWNSHRDKMTNITIPLGKPAAIFGVVVDEAGSPIAGAEVIPYPLMFAGNRYRYLTGSGLREWLTARTDAKGNFRIDNVPADARADLEVRAPERADMVARSPQGAFMYVPGQSDIRIVLPQEARIEGVVVNKATSQPVAGTWIEAWGIHAAPGSSRALSGPDGRFSLANLPGGPTMVRLVCPGTGTAEWVAEPCRVITEVGKTASNVTVAVSKGGIIEVAVTDKAGKPLGGALAYVSRGPGGQGEQGMTGPDGLARIRVNPGEYRLANVVRNGFAGPPSTAASAANLVAVAEGQTVRLPVQLEALPKLRGRVVDGEGRPVAGADVWWTLAEIVASAEDGTFESMASGGLWTAAKPLASALLAWHAQRGLAARMDVQDTSKPVETRLTPGATLTGKVADTDGKPIPNARIRLYLQTGMFLFSIREPPPKTDTQGQYEVKAVPPGRYQVQAAADGFGETRAPVTIEEGQSRSIQTPLALPLANLSISGTVVDIEDKPVADADVSVYGAAQPRRRTRTDAAGRFTVEKVVSRSVQLHADAEAEGKRSYGRVRAKGGDTDVKIVLNQEADETGRIRPIAANPSRPLLGQPLPKLEEFGLKGAAELAAGKRILVCFWDVENRPARRVVQGLAERAAELEKKGVVVVTVHASGADEKQVRDWMVSNKVPFHAGMVPSGKNKAAKALAAWGVGGVPWLILADERHVVTSEGSPLEPLLQQLGLTRSDQPATQPAAVPDRSPTSPLASGPAPC